MKPRGINLVGIVNEITDAGRLFMKYGNYPHMKGVQRFDRASAEALANALVERRAGDEPDGAPFFVGHPDVKELAHKFPDKRAYGWITDIVPEAEGATYLVNWSEDALSMIKQKHFGWWSPYFFGRLKNEDGRKVHELVWLESAGLTNSPNSYSLRLPNEAPDDATQGEKTMNLLQRIIALFGAKESTDENEAVSLIQRLIDFARKIKTMMDSQWAASSAADSALAQLANDAPDEDKVIALVNSLSTRLDAGVTALANERTARTTAESLVVALRTEKDTALTDLANERVARTAAENAMNVAADSGRRALVDLANERRERVTLLVDAAILQGRVVSDKRDERITKILGGDVAAELVTLANEKPLMKQTSVTGGLGKTSSDTRSNINKLVALVNQRMDERKLGPDHYQVVFNEVATELGMNPKPEAAA